MAAYGLGRSFGKCSTLLGRLGINVTAGVVEDALAAFRRLLGELGGGVGLTRYDAGSVALFAAELLELVGSGAGAEEAA